MSGTKPSSFRLKAAVSVSEMAKAVGLSRASFYAYVKRGVFLQPLYSLANRRPLYTAEMQEEILMARQTGMGCNGEYVLFYEKRAASQPASPARSPRADHSAILGGLKSLGMMNVNASQIEEALATNFPKGMDGVDESTLLRTVYRHLRRSGAA